MILLLSKSRPLQNIGGHLVVFVLFYIILGFKLLTRRIYNDIFKTHNYLNNRNLSEINLR